LSKQEKGTQEKTTRQHKMELSFARKSILYDMLCGTQLR